MNLISRALLLPLVLGATSPQLPECSSGELLVSNGSGYRCATMSSLLEKQRASGWGAQNVLPTCSSGEFLVSEGFGSWRCLSPDRLMPRCSSGDSLRSEGSSGWSCQHEQGLPSCSSGEVLASQGGNSWGCLRLKQ
ncbi:MAG: hypothetical protein QM817_12805 [Archangium sp.]